MSPNSSFVNAIVSPGRSRELGADPRRSSRRTRSTWSPSSITENRASAISSTTSSDDQQRHHRRNGRSDSRRGARRSRTAATASHDVTVQRSGRSLAPTAPRPSASARSPRRRRSTMHRPPRAVGRRGDARRQPHATPSATANAVTSNHRAEPRARSKPGSQSIGDGEHRRARAECPDHADDGDARRWRDRQRPRGADRASAVPMPNDGEERRRHTDVADRLEPAGEDRLVDVAERTEQDLHDPVGLRRQRRRLRAPPASDRSPSELSRFAAIAARSCGAATAAPTATAIARSATRRHDAIDGRISAAVHKIGDERRAGRRSGGGRRGAPAS